MGMWVSNGWVQFSAFVVLLWHGLIAGRDSVMALGKVEPKYLCWEVRLELELRGP